MALDEKDSAPGHRDARVQIVELGGAEGNLLVLLAVSGLHLQLHQLLLHPLNRLLLGLHGPAWRDEAAHKVKERSKGSEIYPPCCIQPLRENSLFGLLVFSYFGVGLGALQLSLGIRELIPFSINLRRASTAKCSIQYLTTHSQNFGVTIAVFPSPLELHKT